MLNRRIELVDALAEAKSVRVLDQRLKDRLRKAVQFCGHKPPGPDGGCGIINIHHALEADEDVRPNFLDEQGFERPKALLHKSAERCGSPFPDRTYPRASVTGMPSPV